MDRFIAVQVEFEGVGDYNLKSNMDRFIVSSDRPSNFIIESFKIQYG